MTFQQELASWMTPSSTELSPIPKLDTRAPSAPASATQQRPRILTFLRHCGCPFAEKTFQRLRTLAAVHHPKIDFVAISHSEQEATEKWIAAVGGKGEVQVIVDPTRELYARWGLSTSSAWHVLNPWSLYGVYRLGKEDGIWNRPTESGSRWQQAGSFAVDADDVVRWVNVAGAADEIADFEDAVLALGRSR